MATRDLLAAFSFDADRLHAAQVMAQRRGELPTAARQALLTTFSFSSSREDAARVLMR